MMKTAALVLALLALFASVSCSRSRELEIERISESKQEDKAITVFRVTPNGSPSGEFALKSLQNGQVVLLDGFSFSNMSKPGEVSVITASDRIVLTLDVECSTSRNLGQSAHILTDSEFLGEGMSQGKFIPDQTEHCIYSRSYLVGQKTPPTSCHMITMPYFVDESKRHPATRFYILTVKLEDSL